MFLKCFWTPNILVSGRKILLVPGHATGTGTRRLFFISIARCTLPVLAICTGTSGQFDPVLISIFLIVGLGNVHLKSRLLVLDLRY
jgi:hypothetical protein